MLAQGTETTMDQSNGADDDRGIDAMRAQLDQQAEVISALEARLERLERPPLPSGEKPESIRGDAVGTRRDLLSKVAVAAVGTVAAGTVAAISQATPAAAAAGNFDGSPAVLGTANPTSGTGVRGVAPSGVGVVGVSTNSWGVHGQTSNGYALALEATGSFGLHMWLKPSNFPPLTRASFNASGSVVFDLNGDLWLCVIAGSPGTWRRLAGNNTAGALTVLTTPKRVYDSRPAEPPAIGTKSPLVSNVARVCDLKANGSGVPAGARAVLINLVATNTTGAAGGFLTVWRNGFAFPGTSNLNWSGPNQNVAVTTITSVDASAMCQLLANVATNVAVDVIGYYQ